MRYFTPLIVFFLFVSCGNEYTPTVVSARKDASDIGVEIMKKGGNAFDAMIGVQLALSVSHPTAGNIAGGGFMVYKLKDGTDGTLDFRETAPADSSEKMYQDENGNVIPGLSSRWRQQLVFLVQFLQFLKYIQNLDHYQLKNYFNLQLI